MAFSKSVPVLGIQPRCCKSQVLLMVPITLVSGHHVCPAWCQAPSRPQELDGCAIKCPFMSGLGWILRQSHWFHQDGTAAQHMMSPLPNEGDLYTPHQPYARPCCSHQAHLWDRGKEPEGSSTHRLPLTAPTSVSALKGAEAEGMVTQPSS